MWRRFWGWVKDPHTPAAQGPQVDVDAAKLTMLAYLDHQADMWPEDRNDEGIRLAVDVLCALGVRLQRPAPGEVPVIPGRSS